MPPRNGRSFLRKMYRHLDFHHHGTDLRVILALKTGQLSAGCKRRFMRQSARFPNEDRTQFSRRPASAKTSRSS